MKSKTKKDSIQNLSLSIGHFIRYWGFRRIHGAIWTQVYLSKIPLSCTDLAERLTLSKSLISPALDELCKYQLIRAVPSPNEKTKLYAAAENIDKVVRGVLKNREAKMLQQITQDFKAVEDSPHQRTLIDEQKFKALGEMILSANLMLEMLLSQNDLLGFASEIDL